MPTADQEFVADCWKDFREKAIPENDYQYLSDKFLEQDDKHKAIMEYVFKLYAHKCAGGRANDAEWSWRFGVAAAFAVVAIGFTIEHSITGTVSDARLSLVNIIAAIVVFLAPRWRKFFKR